MNESGLRQAFLLLLVTAISIAFLMMVRTFLLTILLAAIFAGLIYPAFTRIVRICRGQRVIGAAVTIVLLLALVVTPLLFVLGAVAAEALRVNETIGPRISQLIDEPGEIESRLRAIPGYDRIAPYQDEIISGAGALIGGAGSFLFEALSATTRATAVFAFLFVVMLYTLFYFLLDGPRLLTSLLTYLPLPERDRDRMLGTFLSVTRATLKGTLLIAVLQGTLGGLAFWVVGIESAVFWGAVMTLASIVPGIGSVIIWLPASIYLLATGEIWQGVVLIGVGSLLIGTVDNILRPRLVGRDTQMHDLMIFFSTVGGITLFGAVGFIVGPILAALFVTVWQLAGASFRAQFAGERAPAP